MQPDVPGASEDVLIDEGGMSALEAACRADFMRMLVERCPEFNRQDRENILQETWMSFWRRFRGTTIRNPVFLLRRILFRRAHDTRHSLASTRRHEECEVPLEDISEDQLAWEGRSELHSLSRNADISALVERICEELSGDTQSLVRMRMIEGLTFEDIAERRGHSEKVNSLNRKFSRTLKRRMEDLGIDIDDMLYE